MDRLNPQEWPSSSISLAITSGFSGEKGAEVQTFSRNKLLSGYNSEGFFFWFSHFLTPLKSRHLCLRSLRPAQSHSLIHNPRLETELDTHTHPRCSSGQLCRPFGWRIVLFCSFFKVEMRWITVSKSNNSILYCERNLDGLFGLWRLDQSVFAPPSVNSSSWVLSSTSFADSPCLICSCLCIPRGCCALISLFTPTLNCCGTALLHFDIAVMQTGHLYRAGTTSQLIN